MKSVYLLSTLFLLFSVNIFAQNVQDKKVQFDYKQLPSEPVKGVINYNSTVILTYEDEVLAEQAKLQAEYDEAMANYAIEVEGAKADHEAAMKEYRVDKKAWDEKSKVSKLIEKKLLEEDNAPRQPVYRQPSPPSKRTALNQNKIFNTNMLTNTYLDVKGLTKSDDNAFKITATLYGFEYIAPELKFQEKSESKTGSDKKSVTTKYKLYWYEASYKHPIHVKVEAPDGTIVMDEVLEEFSEFKVYKTGSKKYSSPSINRDELKKKIVEKVVEDNMKIINETINSKIGFPTKNRAIIIHKIKAKKHNYDDFEDALESAEDGYKYLAKDEDKAKAKINEAIELWEAALKESNVESKKARVNSNVTIATYLNLIEAYIWVNEYDKVKAYIRKVLTLKVSRKDKKLLERYKDFYKEQKDRAEANS